jgi:hypothetical protein
MENSVPEKRAPARGAVRGVHIKFMARRANIKPSMAPFGPRQQKFREQTMRILKISALALTLAAGGLAFSQAMAEPEKPHGPAAWIDHMCSGEAKDDKMAGFMEKRAEHIATILQLNDAQKATYKEVQDARAKERADFKASVCAKKPDLTSFPGRLAFREQMMQHRLDALKAETPKLLAFYNSLDDKQKAALETMREGMMHRFGEMWKHHGAGMDGPGGHGMMGDPGDTGDAPIEE